MQPEIRKLMYDIKAACTLIIQFTDKKTIHEYLKDPLLRSGVERQFEIIGEALNQSIKIEPAIAEKIRNTRRIINFRNILIHGYSSISDEIVWGIVEKNLPEFMEDLTAFSD